MFCRISKSVHYLVLNSTFQGHERSSEILQAPVSEPLLFTDALLMKVHTLMPLVWRCALTCSPSLHRASHC